MSIAFQRITKLIESDLKHLEAYFKEVNSRVDLGIKSNINRGKYP